jgi:hypothetical protein
MPIREGGHVFDLNSEKCEVCGMPRIYYQDHDEPQCTGRPFDPDDDDQEPRPRPG